MKWEDACFFSPFFQESSFVLSWHVGCRTPRVGKIACAPLAASVRISFQETQLETSVLLSCSFLVCLLIIPVCAWTVKPSLAILYEFFCCHLLDTQNCERRKLVGLNHSSCVSAVGRKIFSISANTWLCCCSQWGGRRIESRRLLADGWKCRSQNDKANPRAQVLVSLKWREMSGRQPARMSLTWGWQGGSKLGKSVVQWSVDSLWVSGWIVRSKLFYNLLWRVGTEQ